MSDIIELNEASWQEERQEEVRRGKWRQEELREEEEES